MNRQTPRPSRWLPAMFAALLVAACGDAVDDDVTAVGVEDRQIRLDTMFPDGFDPGAAGMEKAGDR
jgi:hypothetical protein